MKDEIGFNSIQFSLIQFQASRNPFILFLPTLYRERERFCTHSKLYTANSHITLSSSDIICYVGRDKHENEYLIKYGWPGDMVSDIRACRRSRSSLVSISVSVSSPCWNGTLFCHSFASLARSRTAHRTVLYHTMYPTMSNDGQ